MKALIITILLVTLNQRAQAECTLFCEQTKSSKLITQVVMLPVYFMGQTFLHETSHAVTGAALGMEIYTFKPYPHIGYNKNFVFGAVVFNNNYEKSSYSIQHLAPVILDLSMILASDILLNTSVAKDSKLAPYILVGGMVAPTIDLLLWTNGVTKNSEINQACARLNIWRPALTISLDLLAAVSIYRIINNAKDIFWSWENKESKSSSRLDITPTGISYTYIW